jgi:hypothetical protein
MICCITFGKMACACERDGPIDVRLTVGELVILSREVQAIDGSIDGTWLCVEKAVLG